jgi:CheY-like chemotaxis protein
MLTVLLIDDDDLVRVTLGDMLRSLGHRVTSPLPGGPALEAVKAGGYDVVITDFVMPEVNGSQIVKAVRAANPACPVIGISGGSSDMPANVALSIVVAQGASATLYKPFRKGELDQVLKSVTGAV